MIELNLREAKECVKAAVASNQSVILMGPPGSGKTDLVKQVAREMFGSKDSNKGFLCFEASSIDPTDVRGLLVPNNGKSYFTPSAMLPDVKKHGEKGILLIDEAPSGLPATQVAFHPLFHPDERRLGNDRLPEGWIPMATGNYASDGAGAHNLLTALSDRINIINVVVDPKVWKEDYAIPRGIHPITIGFINFRSDLLSTFSKRNKGELGKSFATPRTHAEASKVLHYADKHGMSDQVLMASLAGWVGEGVAAEMMAFRKVYKELPNVKEIFDGKDIIPTETSILFALVSAMVAHLKETKMPLQNAVDRMLAYSLKLDAEFGGLMIRDAYVSYQQNILKSKEWAKVARRYF